MRSATLSRLSLLVPVCLLAAASIGGPHPTAPGEAPLTLREIQARGIEGRLGLKLGTVLQVAGEVVPNTSRKKAEAGDPFFLRITTVNGTPLKQPVEYRFLSHPLANVPQPKIGDTFRFAGYETGAYTGSPDHEFDYIPAYQTTGFAFNTEFLILKAT